ncbi:hypothetical protein [Mammaliicoccus sciuri]|uniref:hypothetical protein n=1 Tax=Mammaliicoccus sciuri TaxID=1296 RepID=UPI0021D1FAB0|nr:hypothetical protein [Mammaliicoccus sciuri]UXU70150.1 hypothetical protein MUA36_05575 [Mammaliicoccus sciuri]
MYKPNDKDLIQRYFLSKNLNYEESNTFNGNLYNIVYVDVHKDKETMFYKIEVLQANGLSCDDIEMTKESFEQCDDIGVIEMKEFIDYESCIQYIKSRYFNLSEDIYKSIEFLHNDAIVINEIIHKVRYSLTQLQQVYFLIDRDKHNLIPKIKHRIENELHANLEIGKIDDFKIELKATKKLIM